MPPRVPSNPPSPPHRPPPPPPPQKNTFTSIPSISSRSNEADDEQTESSSSSTMGPDQPHTPRRYPGEDTRLTSKKELAGFYSYGWAAEVFVVCGIGSFIPITLEQLAREKGVLLSDKTSPCPTGLNAPKHPRSGGVVGRLAGTTPPVDAGQCVVNILGAEINTASFAMYTFSISVLVQALLIISMSGAADHGHYRKSYLLSFAFIGATCTMLFLAVVPDVYILGALLAIVANTCFGASFVLLNSFLPLLVRHHPTVQYSSEHSSDFSSFRTDEEGQGDEGLREAARYASEHGEEETVIDNVADSTAALLPGNRSSPDLTAPYRESPAAPSPELALSTKISSYGIGIGYIAAVLLQTLSVFIILLTHSTTFSLRLVLFVVGAWWFAFSIPAAFWLRPRPGPPLKFLRSMNARQTCFAYFTYSWKSLGKTVMRARHLKDMLLFLAAWFLLSDSIATVSGTAVLFAKTSLEMKPAALAFINVVATLSGVVGAFTWSRISVWAGLRPIQTILACICLFEVIPLYGLLGYIPAIRRLQVFGLQQPWEMYPLGAVYGFVLGGLSSYCRSLFGELIPPGFEAAFYALYAITDKGSSVFGPAIVGAITDATGEIRPAFWFLAVLVGLPFPIMLFVDVDRGRADAVRIASELQGGVAARRTWSDDDISAGDEERTPLAMEPRSRITEDY